MFKLESYITPILLNYVAKYVKNIREEDAQVSLWEGEATFQNLDLRLDVLEQEFNLPIELISGHIHELSIQVPWTRLTSEPTRIIINTIEFVAKLHSEGKTKKKPNATQAVLREQQQQQQQTGGSGMVNKIINNISIQCHNIILKYVEEDIVVSMNVQLLNFGSASEDWSPAMVDVNPINVIIRKLLQVNDLTICLDKRNASGRIDVCQEPVLYRCTLECRLIHKYNINSYTQTSTLRIGLFTKSLDINVSSLQFPMVMRLIKLLLELQVDEEDFDKNDEDTNSDQREDLDRRQNDIQQGTSYLNWVWNMLPRFDATPVTASEFDLPGHTVDIGVYAEELNFQLKNSEYINDPLMGGMKRIRYTPVMRISLGGIYYERSAVKERDWGNVKAGLSSICVEPLGTYRTEEQTDNKIVNTNPSFCEKSFIDKSLFDENYIFAENTWCTTNYDDYRTRITDEYMLYRSPVLAFDVVEYRPKLLKSKSNETVSNEHGIRVQYRLLSAGIIFHYSQAFLQVTKYITNLINSYDYTAYSYAEKKIDAVSKFDEPLNKFTSVAPDEDLEHLLLYVRNCNFKFQMRDMVLQFHTKQTPDNPSPANRLPSHIKQSLPYMQVSFTSAEGTLCKTQHVMKIINIALKLADRPIEVVDACYDIYKFDVKNMILSVMNTNSDQEVAKFVVIPKIQIQYNRLLFPHLWRLSEVALDIIEVNFDVINLEFSKREIIMASRIFNLIFEYNFTELEFLSNMVLSANKTTDVIKLQTLLSKFRINIRRYRENINILVSLRSASSEVCHTKMNIHNLILSTMKGIHSKWLELQLQIPLTDSSNEGGYDYNPNTAATATAVGFWLEPFRFTVDMYLLQFLSYQETRDVKVGKESDIELLTAPVPLITMPSIETIGRKAIRSNRKVSQPEETVHLSSDRDDKCEAEQKHTNKRVLLNYNKINILQNIDFLKSLVIWIEFTGGKVQIAEVISRKDDEILNEYTLVTLPQLNIKSSHAESLRRAHIRSHIKVDLQKSSCSWTMNLSDMSIKYRKSQFTENYLSPINTTVIIALSHKYVKRNTKIESHTGTSSKEFVTVPSREVLDEYRVTDLNEQTEHKRVDWVQEIKEPEEHNLGKSILSVNLHINTSVIELFGQRFKLFHEHAKILQKAVELLAPIKTENEIKTQDHNTIIILTPTEDNQIVKDFLELENNDSKTLLDPIEKTEIIVFCQWTVQRVSLEMKNTVGRRSYKVILYFEDLLLNVDKHQDFIKYTSKIENMSLNYYESLMSNEWIPNESIRIRMLSDNNNLPFLNVVQTIVNLKDLHSRIGAQTDNDTDRTLSELLISIEAVEVILNLDQIIEFILPFCEMLEVIRNYESAVPLQETSNAMKITAVSDLPLIHVSSKGLAIYMPIGTGSENCTVLLCKIGGINMTPNLDNPLQRNPVRNDLYNKAEQLGMLDTPGAIVENRQYELVFEKISLASGKWSETLEYLRLDAVPKNMNPAFEWNNQTVKPELRLVNIFNNFKFAITFAPAITCHNVLVCGQSLEFNCCTDFIATITIQQISLLSCITIRLQNLSSILSRICAMHCQHKLNSKYPSKSMETIRSNKLESIKSEDSVYVVRLSCDMAKNNFHPKSLETKLQSESSSTSLVRERFLPNTLDSLSNMGSDSGIQSCNQHNREKLGDSTLSILQRARRHIPNTISLIAGIFVIKIFDIQYIDGEPLSRPLISCTISQPSFMFMQNIFDSVKHASIFNFNLHIPNSENFKLMPQSLAAKQVFQEVLIDTKPGDTNSSGIPPPLFSYKANVDRQQNLEIDIELRKPININCCENLVQQTVTDLLQIYMTLMKSPCFAVRSERPIIRCSKLRQVQLQCLKADRLHFACDRVMLKFYNSDNYDCKAVCTDLNVNIKFSNRPEKASIKGSLGAFYIQTKNKIFLHPILLRMSTDLISETWCEQPLINTSAKMNVVQLDIGVMQLLQFRQAYTGFVRILSHFRREWQNFLQQRPIFGEAASVNKLTLQLLTLNTSSEMMETCKNHKNNSKKEEFYQDDLRAGAFQFVDLHTDTVLPMPYQIQIIKKNYGIICWRYPQPRKMVNIEIFPVPMPVNNPIQIKCRMEYFSETYETFLHYCDFILSETVGKTIILPDREVCATIFRVIILQSLISVNGECFDASEEDEELQSIPSENVTKNFKTESDHDFILHPKVLVGCMRVDTVFQIQAVPKIQLLLSCNGLLLNLLNQPDSHIELPLSLKRYHMKKTTQISQTFLSALIEHVNIHISFYGKSDYSVDAGLWAKIKVLDYGFLNMLYLMEPMSFQSHLRVKGRPLDVKANFLIDKLRFNCGPSVIHSLLSSKLHWEEVLRSDEILLTLIPKCVIINRTESILAFGQTGTKERIWLEPMECQMYHFCNDYHNQELSFFIADEELHVLDTTESVRISFKFKGKYKLHTLCIGDKCICLKIGKLSSTQIYILIKGQIELFSMVPYDLLVEFRRTNLTYEDEHSIEYSILAKGRSSFYRSVERNTELIMRLKLRNGQSRGRSGDIPLKTNNSLPWLVKIPVNNSAQFISVWVRILREDIKLHTNETFQPQRIFIIIWPIFELRNMLSSYILAEESTTQQKITVPSEGGRVTLNTPTTHLTEHNINFKFGNHTLGTDSTNSYTLMLRSMDWHKFFYYDETTFQIDNALVTLSKAIKPNWPYNDEEELRVRRNLNTENALDVIYRCQATREFSCTLGLEILPWGMFINSTGIDLSVNMASKRERIVVKTNSLQMITILNAVFTLDVRFGTNWVSSQPLSLSFVPVANQNGRCLTLVPNDTIDIVILCNEEVIKLLLNLKIENGCHIFKARSKFIFANFSKLPLKVLTLAMEQHESATRADVQILDLAKKHRDLMPAQAGVNNIGVTIDVFHDIHTRKVKRTNEMTFVYFACFLVGKNSDISIPIALNQPFTRRCFSIQTGKDSIPLAVTLIEKDEVHYVSVFKDIAPAMIINNHTNIKFIVAQTSASGNSNVTNTTSEYIGKHFVWHQLVTAYSKTYYTPPEMYANFPDLEFSLCNLSLALYNDELYSKKKIYWSKPIRTDKTWKKFLHVPNHGDVKVVVCDKHRMIQVSIYYISQQMEFLVKDLRSRLLKPNNSEFTIEEDFQKRKETETETIIVPPPNSQCMHFSTECMGTTKMKMHLFIKKLVFSLQTDNEEYDYLKTEVCNIYIDDLMLCYDDDVDKRQFKVQIPNMQIDNQLYSSGKYDFPVLLCAEELYKRTKNLPDIHQLSKIFYIQNENKPMVLLTFSFYQDEIKLCSINCRFSPFRAYIEDNYINQLLEALIECEPSNCIYSPHVDTERIHLVDGQVLLPASVAAQVICIAEPFQLHSFVIEPISILLSVHTSLRLYIALDHSPLSFSRYECTQILTLPLRFGQSLGMHYLSGAIFGAGWVVGSLEILGSPSGLARSFSTGLRDFISMPVEGLFRGPWGFILGITQGSASLLRNITAGTVNSVTKLASSVARNLDRLTLDEEHIERTEALRRLRPQGFAEGLTYGLTGLGISILGALGGLAHHTLEARSSFDVVAGITKGIVGAFAKPISGAAEMLALAGQGVLYTVGFNAMPQQCEPSVSHNPAVHPSSYRIWRMLPVELKSDQVLFSGEIMLLSNEQLRAAYAFLTATILTFLEAESDKLTFVASVDKIELVGDREDRTKFYLRQVKSHTDAIEEHMNYTNQRIMKFLSTSRTDLMSTDSLNDLLIPIDDTTVRHTDWIFFLSEHMGEHLMYYIRIINKIK